MGSDLKGRGFLLDTHIWLWSLLEPSRLSQKAVRVLTDAKTELWLSPVTIWEFLTLCQKGRLNPAMDPQAWIASAQSILPAREATLTFEVALATTQVQLPHNDPADRFLAATARVFDLTLITADQHLIGGKGFRVLPVR